MENFGLLLNILGTLFIAFSVGKKPGGGGLKFGSRDGKAYNFAVVKSAKLFWWGVASVVLGFFLQWDLDYSVNDFFTDKIVLLIAGIAIIVILLSYHRREKLAGICAVAINRFTKKEENQTKIIAFLEEHGEASNTEIREHIGVSDRTAVRYMTALEKKGLIEQVGKIGRGVTYRLIKK